MEAYVRRIQRTGKSTYTVSLPKSWVKRMGLKRFDEVQIVEFERGLMVFVGGLEADDEAEVAVGQSAEPETVVRLFFSKYLDGYGKIKVQFNTASPQAIGMLKDCIRRWLVGVEIVEESSTQLVAQCLPMHDKLPVKTSIERMGGITSNMIGDAVTSFLGADEELAKELLKRDDEVDRFYHFVVRQMNIAVKDQRILKSLNLSSPADCISYALAAKNIERAADHAENICRKVLSIRRAPRQDEKIVKLSAELVNVFRSSVNSLLTPDVFFADKTLRNAEHLAERIEQLQALPGYESSAHQTVLGSLKRVAEYAADLSETAINLSGRAVTVTA
jgi:phosphate uptake regulator